MAEDQQKGTQAEDTADVQIVDDQPSKAVAEVVETEAIDDTPAVAQIGDETAEALDTSAEKVHPESPEATISESEAEEAEKSVVDKTVDAVKEVAEEVKKGVDKAVDTVKDAVEDITGGDGGDGRLLEQAVADAVSELDVPTAVEDELIIGGVREPITSVDSATSLPQGSYGYTGEIVGRVVKLEDLNERLDEEGSGEMYDQLAALIEETLTDVTEHEIVKGRVVSIGEKDVVIDIGFKSDGVVSKNEFDRALEAGEEVEVYLERIEDYHGQLVLSKTKADTFRRWERVETAFENEEVLEGTIVRRIKGGMIVELFEGLEAFLPGSQIDVRPVRDFDAYLDKRMEFKVVKINPANENVVVSHKALIEKELESQRETILSTMEAGQVLEGLVKNITDFGVFIDLGGVDGLLHITDLSWGRVSHPSELVELDQQLKVVVLDYDKERQRISLGLKQLQPHPWDNIGEKFSEGDIVEGKVVSITDYGAFVELEKGIEGLVHISEMSWTDHIRHPSQKVSLGQLVNVKILNIDDQGKKISLGMKQLEQNPWVGLADRYPPGTVLRGKVRNITNFGVFVEIEPGIDGLVHISDLSWTKKVRHPGELVKKGQELDVVILDVDENRQRVSLGHKQIETNPWNDFANVYAEGSDTKATVAEIEDKGIVVELPLGVQAFVPGSELKSGPGHFQTSYQVGDEVELRVIRMDVTQKEIVLSETAKDRAEERAQRSEEERERREERQQEERAVRSFQQKAKAASGPTTLGELSGLEDLKRQMEAAEAAADADTSEPQVITSGPASGEMEGIKGVAAEGSGEEKDADNDPTEPPAEQAQRQEDAGDHPPAEKSQATLKDTGEEHTSEAARAAEAIADAEQPTTGRSEKPVAVTEADRSTGEIEAFTKPGDTDERAITTDDVVEQAADADEDASTETEMGKADVTVTADSKEEAEDVVAAAESDEEKEG